MAEASHHLRIFLCHSSGDKQVVRELYWRLRAEKFDPWLDEKDILPGQKWRQEISEAVEAADVVLVCLSRGSVSKTGYVQWEIKYALDVADRHPDGTIFLIPLRLDECDIPERLGDRQWVNLYEPEGYERLLSALRRRAEPIPVNPGADKLPGGEAGKGESAPRATEAQTRRSFFQRTKLSLKLLTAAATLFVIAALYVSWDRLPIYRVEPHPCPKLAGDGMRYYEAEDAILSGGTSRNSEHRGHSGNGFVSGYGPLWTKLLRENAPSATFLVDAPSDGVYQVELCYANGNDSTKALTIFVGDDLVERTILPNTSNWNFWHTRVETLPLKAGRNLVSYRKSTFGDGEVNLDFIAVAREPILPPSPQPTAAPMATATPTATPTPRRSDPKP